MSLWSNVERATYLKWINETNTRASSTFVFSAFVRGLIGSHLITSPSSANGSVAPDWKNGRQQLLIWMNHFLIMAERSWVETCIHLHFLWIWSWREHMNEPELWPVETLSNPVYQCSMYINNSTSRSFAASCAIQLCPWRLFPIVVWIYSKHYPVKSHSIACFYKCFSNSIGRFCCFESVTVWNFAVRLWREFRGHYGNDAIRAFWSLPAVIQTARRRFVEFIQTALEKTSITVDCSVGISV